jgi:hypothetical protein
MFFTRRLICFVACLSLSAPAIAASLTGVQGVVLVNRGNGYQAAFGGSELKPGDVVVVNPGGTAQISYGDGCSVPLAVGAVVTVSAQSPCAGQAGNPGGPGTEFFADGPAIALLGVGVAAGAVGFLLANQKNRDNPASP